VRLTTRQRLSDGRRRREEHRGDGDEADAGTRVSRP
jgi:hypothetical protein